MNNETFTVIITPEGAKRAQPAVWYAYKGNKKFVVEKSKRWKGVYQVVKGEYKEMIIAPNDCKII